MRFESHLPATVFAASASLSDVLSSSRRCLPCRGGGGARFGRLALFLRDCSLRIMAFNSDVWRMQMLALTIFYCPSLLAVSMIFAARATECFEGLRAARRAAHSSSTRLMLISAARWPTPSHSSRSTHCGAAPQFVYRPSEAYCLSVAQLNSSCAPLFHRTASDAPPTSSGRLTLEFPACNWVPEALRHCPTRMAH